jgi:hypothetical protein
VAVEVEARGAVTPQQTVLLRGLEGQDLLEAVEVVPTMKML